MSNTNNTPVVENLIISLIVSDQFTSLRPILKLINEAGGNIVNCRLSSMGEYLSGSLQIDGHWDCITKIESSLNNFAQNNTDCGVQLISQRTKTLQLHENLANPEAQKEYLPYKMSINNLDEPGLLDKIAEFFILQEITIQDLISTCYTSEFDSELSQIDIKIKIPTDIHIPSLKEQFDILCYNENLDAYLAPCKIS